MAKDAPTRRVFPNLGRRVESEEKEELTSAAPSSGRENAAALPTGASHDAAQEEREASEEEQESTAAAAPSSVPAASNPISTVNPLDENRGADPAFAGDLFHTAPTLNEDNILFGTLPRNQVAKLHHHEDILRMASRMTIAQMAALYQQKYGEEVKNKRISVRLDTAKDKVAKARGCLRKDIVAAFEEEKRKYGVEKAKNMEAGRKRKAQKQAAAAAAKPPAKKRKRSSIPRPVPEEAEEDSDIDDFAALENSLPDFSDEDVAEMARQEQRGQLQVKPFVSKKGSKKRKRSSSPEPEPEEADEESLPEYSDEEMAEMARKAARDSGNESRQSSSPPMPPHLQRGAVERGEYTEEHAADALMMLSRKAEEALAQQENGADAEGEEEEE